MEISQMLQIIINKEQMQSKCKINKIMTFGVVSGVARASRRSFRPVYKTGQKENVKERRKKWRLLSVVDLFHIYLIIDFHWQLTRGWL